MRVIRTNLLNPVSDTQTDLYKDYLIGISEGRITLLKPYESSFEGNYEDRRDAICCPGFIDLHVHLSQYRMRGLYRPALLPWLHECVFPEEARSKDRGYANALAREFFSALFASGTTMSVIYTAPFLEACEEAFSVAAELGARAKIGMTLMDRNSPTDLLQSTDYAISKSIRLYEQYHSSDALLDYIFTPRFAPTCSSDLMRSIAEYAAKNNAWIQSHLSENKDEISWVKQLFQASSYTAVYDKLGILSPHTIMAHAIHLDGDELAILKANEVKIAHCPDSNFYLKSGEFDLPRIKESGLEFALGSDVGAGTSLRMLYHAKIMNFRQSVYPVLPQEAFYSITLGAAKLLEMDDRIGSIKLGKDADLVLLDWSESLDIDESSLSRLCFHGSELAVSECIIQGRTVHKLNTGKKVS